MRGYTVEKMGYLTTVTAECCHPVLAYLLSETHLPQGATLLDCPTGYRPVVLPAPTDRSHEGQALLVHRAAQITWRQVGDTVIAVQLQWGSCTLYVVSVYIPPLTIPHRARLASRGLDISEQGALVDLETALDSIPTDEAPVIVVGDHNARTASLGTAAAHQQPRTSSDTLVDTRGRALLQMAGRHHLAIATGTTPASSGPTSLGPGSLPAMSVVDYVLVTSQAQDYLQHLVVEDAHRQLSDHTPIVIDFALPSAPELGTGSQSHAQPTSRPRWEPGSHELWKEHMSQPTVVAALTAATTLGDVQAEATAVEEVLVQACTHLGLTRITRPHNPNQDTKARPSWFGMLCRQAQREMWRAARIHGRDSLVAREARSAFRRTCRQAARRHQQGLPELLKKAPARFWALLDPPRLPVEAPLPALTAHFQRLLSPTPVAGPATTPSSPPAEVPPTPLDPPISGTELLGVLQTRYRGAASSGLSQVPSQCIRHLPPDALEPLSSWLQGMSSRGLPPSWQTTVITPLWKGKGSPTDASTYRGLSVMHPLSKLYALTLLSRMDSIAEDRHWRAREQAGFRSGYRLEDHQLLLTYLMLGAAHGRGPVALAFIDLEKAYDLVPRTRLWEVLATELGVPQDIRDGITALYHDTCSQVRVGGETSEPFSVSIGVKQGCPASPMLFSLFFDRVSSYIQQHAPTRLRTRTPYLATLVTYILLYADDVVLLAHSADRLQQLLTVFGDFCTDNSLRVSGEKTQVIVHQCGEGVQFTCQGKALVTVEGYRYLGQQIRISRSLLRDLAQTQIARFQRAATRLRHSTRQLQLRAPGLRVQLAQSLCISHLLFGCVVWSPVLPTRFSLHPPRRSPIAQPMQVAYNAVLRWALELPATTRVELLHLLANLPPPGVLVAKQLVRYVESLYPTTSVQQTTVPGRPRHATEVWEAIVAVETARDSPLQVTPCYWQDFVFSRGGVPSIRDLYAEARELITAGLGESTSLQLAGTQGIWQSTVPYLFVSTAQTRHLPDCWRQTCPPLEGTQLRVTRPQHALPEQPPSHLVRGKALSWLCTGSTRHLHTLVDLLAPAGRRLRDVTCPWCGLVPASWTHTLEECRAFRDSRPPAEQPWVDLVHELGIGFVLVAASTRMVPVLQAASGELYEECVAPAHCQEASYFVGR